MNNQIQRDANAPPILVHSIDNPANSPELIPNTNEKFGICLKGIKSVPFAVFLILVGIGFNLIMSFILANYLPFGGGMFLWSSFGLLFFAFFVWLPTAKKIENSSSTVRYGLLYLINNSLLNLITLSFPLMPTSLWKFVLFETLLISISNKNKTMKFFAWKVTGKTMINLVIFYNIVFNFHFFFSLIITIIYAFLYKKYIMKKLIFSNEKIERIESFFCINYLKTNISTFISLSQSLAKRNNHLNQNNAQQIGNGQMNQSINSSYAPLYSDPTYYSQFQSSVVAQTMMPMIVENMQNNINIEEDQSPVSNSAPNPDNSDNVNQSQENNKSA